MRAGVEHSTGVHRHVHPTSLLTPLTGLVSLKVMRQRFGRFLRPADQQDRFDPIGVGGSSDVAALSVQRGPEPLGRGGDVVAEQEVLFDRDAKAIYVDPATVLRPLEDFAWRSGLNTAIARVAEEERLRRSDLVVAHSVQHDIGAHHAAIGRLVDQGVEGLDVLESVLRCLGGRDSSVARLDQDIDVTTVEGGEGVFESDSELPDDLSWVGSFSLFSFWVRCSYLSPRP